MKKALLLILVLVSALVLAACGGGGEEPSGDDSAAAEPIVLKIGHVEAEDRSVHQALLVFKDELESKTEGRISVEIFPNAELGGDEELCEAVAMGTVQMVLPSTSVLTAYNERIGILDMPYLFNDAQAAFDALDGALGEQIDEWIAGNGFVSLGYLYNGPRSTTNNVRPIYTPDDLAGLKMRVMSSPVFITMYETLGANATPMSFSELYTALQQNVVQGQENPPTLIYASGFQQVQKYLSMDAHVHNFLPILTNEAWLEGLSEEDRAILEECCDNFVKLQRETELADNETIVQKLEDEGMEVNYLTDEQYQLFVDKIQPMYDQYKAEWGTEIFDLAESFNK
ncbi:MAG: TRAP transporter substrate-binding protein [Firmicutes bacterium]|nr:TRAP transporter substrate-binding protein [Bacillota bacterium]